MWARCGALIFEVLIFNLVNRALLNYLLMIFRWCSVLPVFQLHGNLKADLLWLTNKKDEVYVKNVKNHTNQFRCFCVYQEKISAASAVLGAVKSK